MGKYICDFCDNEIVENRGRNIAIDPKDVGKLCSKSKYLICDKCFDKYGRHLNIPLMYTEPNDDVDKEKFKEQILDTILLLENPFSNLNHKE